MFNPQLLRKFPPQMMRPGMPTMPVPNDFENIDPQQKREFFGDRLYGKISTNPAFAQFSDLFPKIIGIFLDLDENLIHRLLHDDAYFTSQVSDAVRLLRERAGN